MKKILIPLITLAFIFGIQNAFSQAGSITIGLQGNACDELILEWTSTYSFVGAGSNQWTQSTITITYPDLANTDANTLGTITSLLTGFTGWQYNTAATLVGGPGGTWQREVILVGGSYTQDIPIGTTEIISIQLNGAGTANFNIADPSGNTDISSFNFSGQMWDGGPFSPASVTGQNLNDGIVWNGTEWCGGSGSNNEPGSGDGALNCDITGAGGVLTQWGAQVNALTIQSGADLTINPAASLTANGATTINQSQGLVIAHDASGSGSFIDNGTITYGSGGSAKVQTYLTNTASAGNLYIHQIGPTVEDPSFGTTYPGEFGVFLGAFDLQTLGTYAYRYREPTNSWENIFASTTPVPRGLGILLSTTNGNSATLDMVGELTTAPSFISTTTSTNTDLIPYTVTLNSTQGNGLFMASNPFPSGLDLEAWRSYMLNNSAGLGNTIWVWDQSASNYETGTSSFGGWTWTGALSLTSGVINPGQGFFTQFTNTSVNFVAFNNTLRQHLHAPFIKEMQNTFPELRFVLNNETSRDEVVVKMAEDATPAYDEMEDGPKWASMIEEASELMTVTSDDFDLTVNFIPPLGTEAVTVPMKMKCGTDGDHILEATEILNFEEGTQIFLEDLITGGEWIDLNENPVYEFSAQVDDPLHRFNIHFFGPTGIEEPGAEQAIRIYSHKEYAYIMNDGSEEIEEFIVYNMTGQEVIRGTLPSSSLNKIYIGDRTAYYVVQVITNNRSYNGKVLITK